MSDNEEIKLDAHMPNSYGDFNDEEHAWMGWMNRSDENKPGWMNCGYEMSGRGIDPAQLIRYVLSAHFKKTNSDFTAKDWNDLIEWISRDEEKYNATSERLRLEREERESAKRQKAIDEERCVDCGRRTDFGTGSKAYLESIPYDKHTNWLGHPRRFAWSERVPVNPPEKGRYPTGPWRCGGDQLEACKAITASKEE
tara:strand:- start:205 stop:795 length:591 start_codon:yes stop_codon:yes gene_type:complete